MNAIQSPAKSPKRLQSTYVTDQEGQAEVCLNRDLIMSAGTQYLGDTVVEKAKKDEKISGSSTSEDGNMSMSNTTS